MDLLKATSRINDIFVASFILSVAKFPPLETKVRASPVNFGPVLAKTLGDGRNAYVASLKEKLPLHRLGTPAEVGAAVIFLMSNGFMNGETLHIDGGSRLV